MGKNSGQMIVTLTSVIIGGRSDRRVGQLDVGGRGWPNDVSTNEPCKVGGRSDRRAGQLTNPGKYGTEGIIDR